MKNLLIIVLTLVSTGMSAQVGINTTTPQGILDVKGPQSGIAVLGTNTGSWTTSDFLPFSGVQATTGNRLLFGWNRSNGRGEQSFINSSTGGTAQGFGFFDLLSDGTTRNLAYLSKLDGLILNSTLKLPWGTPSESNGIQIGASETFDFNNGTQTTKVNVYGISSATGGGSGLTYMSGFGGLRLFTNNSPRVNIMSSGNVGIGVVSPVTRLDVSGYIKLGSSDANADAAPEPGMIRFNNVTNKFQGYVADAEPSSAGLQPAWVDFN